MVRTFVHQTGRNTRSTVKTNRNSVPPKTNQEYKQYATRSATIDSVPHKKHANRRPTLLITAPEAVRKSASNLTLTVDDLARLERGSKYASTGTIQTDFSTPTLVRKKWHHAVSVVGNKLRGSQPEVAMDIPVVPTTRFHNKHKLEWLGARSRLCNVCTEFVGAQDPDGWLCEWCRISVHSAVGCYKRVQECKKAEGEQPHVPKVWRTLMSVPNATSNEDLARGEPAEVPVDPVYAMIKRAETIQRKCTLTSSASQGSIEQLSTKNKKSMEDKHSFSVPLMRKKIVPTQPFIHVSEHSEEEQVMEHQLSEASIVPDDPNVDLSDRIYLNLIDDIDEQSIRKVGTVTARVVEGSPVLASSASSVVSTISTSASASPTSKREDAQFTVKMNAAKLQSSFSARIDRRLVKLKKVEQLWHGVVRPHSTKYLEELPLKIGERIRVLEQSDQEWWQACKSNGHTGLIPSSSVVPLRRNEQIAQLLQNVVVPLRSGAHLRLYKDQVVFASIVENNLTQIRTEDDITVTCMSIFINILE